MSLPIFFIPIIIWWVIQVIKLIIDKFNWEVINIDRLFVAGWFPSVHSGLSTSLLVAIWYVNGIHSSLFAITLIFSILFWYDASNVRYQAWKHAEVINKMRNQLSDIFKMEYCNVSVKEKLKERLWHTFWEVIWWIIISWILTFALIYWLKYFWIHIW
jgi:acid phosphatase family membrane protein YuiD